VDTNYLRCAVIWSDPDLLEIHASVRFRDWAGAETAYVSRGEIQEFAEALKEVVTGGRSASLNSGQEDLSFVKLNIREYGLAKRLALDLHLGRASGTVLGSNAGASELRLSVPVERGQLTGFVAALRRSIAAESGEAVLPLPSGWS
jgi:hypothetical protein